MALFLSRYVQGAFVKGPGNQRIIDRDNGEGNNVEHQEAQQRVYLLHELLRNRIGGTRFEGHIFVGVLESIHI